MMFKRLMILGGAALLVAGCGTSPTAPILRVDAPSDARAATTKQKAGSAQTNPMAVTAADSTTCRSGWPISSGFIDTTCIIDRD